MRVSVSLKQKTIKMWSRGWCHTNIPKCFSDYTGQPPRGFDGSQLCRMYVEAVVCNQQLQSVYGLSFTQQTTELSRKLVSFLNSLELNFYCCFNLVHTDIATIYIRSINLQSVRWGICRKFCVLHAVPKFNEFVRSIQGCACSRENADICNYIKLLAFRKF